MRQNDAHPTPGQVAAPSTDGPKSEAAQLLTAAELAERWQMSVASIYALTRNGSIPTVHIGPRLYRYRLQAVEQWEREGGVIGC